ncbi:MAG: hypothetical protein SFU98_05090 [Leptospiraceae bacterium]|nr:hypothetical protein [Leptospiraceae bacterium]
MRTLFFFSIIYFLNCVIHHTKEATPQLVLPSMMQKNVSISIIKTEEETFAFKDQVKRELNSFGFRENLERYRKVQNNFANLILTEIMYNRNLTVNKNSEIEVRIVSVMKDPNGNHKFFLFSLLNLLTIGVVPTIIEHDFTFKVQVVSGNSMISEQEYFIHDSELWGWICIPFNLVITPFISNLYAFENSRTKDQIRAQHHLLKKISFDTNHVLQNIKKDSLDANLSF